MMKTTCDLLGLLKEYNVIIPKIQRDYAQGRADKKYIRKVFLSQIKDSIKNNFPITLDFVYGNIERNNCFYPIDGQQRLTTLWLVYWYIAFKAEKLPDVKDILHNFKYETRQSSKDFCEALCNKCDISEYKGSKKGSVSEYIKAQNWFFPSWLQDPTITSMLRTLSGDGKTNDDNIEGVFSEYDPKQCWENMDVDNNIAPIKFELMVIGNEKLPVADDLYIKMNARGKILTDFENFKADFVAWMQKYNGSIKNQEGKEIEYKHFFPARLDNQWTDVFWQSAKKDLGEKFDGKIDASFFSFINRYTLNRLCLTKKDNKYVFQPSDSETLKDKKDGKNCKEQFDRLYTGLGKDGFFADDTLVKYEGFEVYNEYLTFDTVKQLNILFDKLSNSNCLDTIKKALIVKDIDDNNDKRDMHYSFIPQYYYEKNEIKLKNTFLKERVYFLAICLFLERNDTFDSVDFKKWMRVVKNITENAGIENISVMVKCLRKINDIAIEMEKCNNCVYTCLSYMVATSKEDSLLEKQFLEEIEKAKKITENPDWEKPIIEAEQYAFFNGTIRFLYRDAEGKVNWDDFEQKFENAKKLFESNKVPKKTIVSFLKLFNKFKDIDNKYFFTSIGYNNRNSCWKKNILCNESLKDKVHFLLLSQMPQMDIDQDYQDFLNSGLIDVIVDKDENYRYRYRWYPGRYWMIYKEHSQTEGVSVRRSRKKKCAILYQLASERKIEVMNKYYDCGYYWGTHIDFRYNNRIYRWEVIGKDERKAEWIPHDIIFLIKDIDIYEVGEWNTYDDLLNLINKTDL